MIYLTPKFSRMLPEIWLNVRIRSRLYKRGKYRHFGEILEEQAISELFISQPFYFFAVPTNKQHQMTKLWLT